MKLAGKDIAALGFMTFAMYLGAGNLIFPPLLGYLAGENLAISMVGFLITGVGLPALALVVIALVNGSDNLTKAFPRKIAIGFWVMLFIVIGPAFAIPRAITVAYQFTFSPFIGDAGLVWFSAAFCLVAILFSMYPGKLVSSLGKLLTPLLVVILTILAGAAFLFPSGDFSVAQSDYVDGALSQGLTQGYMTMDALGSIGFGWIIFRAIQGMGVSEPKDITRYTLMAAGIYAAGITLVYLTLAYIGLTSPSLGYDFQNGGEILTAFTQFHFGYTGTILLGAVMLLACLTTAIGVTTAAGEFHAKTFPWFKYRTSICSTMILASLVATIGLSQLLTITLPAVVALHPIAIALLLTALCRHYLSQAWVMIVVTVAALFGLLDACHILGKVPESLSLLCEQYMPLYDFHAAWLLPTLISLVGGVVMSRKHSFVSSAV